MLEAYRQHVAERAALGIPPLPLSKQQTQALVELLQTPPAGEEAFLVDLLTHRVPAGVDDAAKVKAAPAADAGDSEVRAALLKIKKPVGYSDFAEANGFNIRTVRRTARAPAMVDTTQKRLASLPKPVSQSAFIEFSCSHFR